MPETFPQPDTAPSPLSTGEVKEIHPVGYKVLPGMKLVYVKRWRTIIQVPETYAAEIVAALTQPPATEQIRREVIEECAKVTIELTLKHGKATGTDYEQGVQDHGYRLLHQIRALAATEQER